MVDPFILLGSVVSLAWNCFLIMDQAASTNKAAAILAKEIKDLHSLLKTIEAEHPDEKKLAKALEVT